jgi:hypothetical protein
LSSINHRVSRAAVESALTTPALTALPLPDAGPDWP